MNCTRQTLRQALDVLESDGLILRRKGSGTFVRALPPRQDSGLVGVMTCNQGHVYHEMTHAIAERLQADAWVPTILAQSQALSPSGSFELKPLQRLVQLGCRHLVLQSAAQDMAELVVYLDAAHGRFDQVVWMLDGSVLAADRPGDAVGLDYVQGFLLALRHLWDLGHRRVALGAPRPAPGAIDHCGTHWRLALQQCGPWERADLLALNEHQRDDMRHLLLQPDRPTAIIASDDWRATVAVDLARELGLSVPGDLSVIGGLDTPWSAEYNLTTTSAEISAQADAIAELVGMRQVPGRRRTVLITPRLIVRSSTAAAATTG